MKIGTFVVLLLKTRCKHLYWLDFLRRHRLLLCKASFEFFFGLTLLF